MKLITLSIYAIFATLTMLQNVAFAQETSSSISPDEMVQEDPCAKAYANSKIDPVRDKISIDGSPITDDMLKNNSIPTAEEKKALRAYIAAMVACDREWGAINENIGIHISQFEYKQDKKSIEAKIEPLIDAKITYAEYNRRQEQIRKRDEQILKGHSLPTYAEFLKSKNVGSDDPHWYENHAEAQLSPLKQNYPANSPWWGFYNYAIATAKEADSEKITREEADKLIEDKWLKVNQEIEATATPKVVTLNCSMTGPQGQQKEIPFSIDYTNMKVNGYKADFYENEIRWSNPSSDGAFNFHFTLNRLSGFINSGNDQFPSLMAGHCAPATKQF